jgi:hypothetical protein
MRVLWLLGFWFSACNAGLMPGGGGPPGGALDLGTAAPQRLRFGVFGDARPASQNDSAGFPSSVLTSIFTQAEERALPFMVGTGDYMFASGEKIVATQVSLVLQAEAPYHGPVYHTLGNHECNGWTASNCPLGNETPNVRAFMNNLAPKGATRPWFRIDVDTPKGKAKLLFVAANAWSDDQAAWLSAQVADPTAYTFAVRHEPASEPSAPGVTPSEEILHAAPLTLELLGHYHSYQRVDTVHVISGNAGAPLSQGSYGYLIVEQLDDGNIAVSEIDQTSNMPIDAFRVTPTGDAAP